MAISDHAQQIIQEMGAAIGIPEMALDAEGFCSLSFDDRIDLGLQYNPNNDSLILFSDIGDIPVDRMTDVYRHMLRANRFWQGTGGATLSVDEDNAAAIAQQEPCEGLTAVKLQGLIERFVDAAEEWAEFIGEWASEAGSTPSPDAPPDGPHMGIRA